MDKLEHIFALQKQFNDELFSRRPEGNFTREEWLQKLILATNVELAELADEINYKWWKDAKPIDEDAVKEELVDVLHFFVCMCLRMGMTAEELHARYIGKNEENFNRQRGLSAKPGYAKEEM